jgi:hypothetical protein
MIPLLLLSLGILPSLFKSKCQLEVENVALRHQVVVSDAHLRQILKATPTITTRSGRTGRWAKMHRALLSDPG